MFDHQYYYGIKVVIGELSLFFLRPGEAVFMYADKVMYEFFFLVSQKSRRVNALCLHLFFGVSGPWTKVWRACRHDRQLGKGVGWYVTDNAELLGQCGGHGFNSVGDFFISERLG